MVSPGGGAESGLSEPVSRPVGGHRAERSRLSELLRFTIPGESCRESHSLPDALIGIRIFPGAKSSDRMYRMALQIGTDLVDDSLLCMRADGISQRNVHDARGDDVTRAGDQVSPYHP